jgi:NAD(P)-dependent dehydrogenase (short-subunit alcohol dehydrogenase family)
MAKERRSLSGKVVAITGGARGIGKATAAALVRKGCRVAIGDLQLELAEETAAELGGGTVALALDVTDRSSFAHFLDEAERQLGPIDAVVNNAGIMPVTPLVEESPDSIARQLEINLRAVVHGTQEAMRRMVPRRSGHIVQLASLAGRTGFPQLATYCATKHGVVGLSEAVALELRGTGVEVSVVMPGIVKTELTIGLQDARGVKTLVPEEVADAIVAVLKRPRFDVFLPPVSGALVRLGAALPRRLRLAVARGLRVDQATANTDRPARAEYEARAAASAPAAEQERSVA